MTTETKPALGLVTIARAVKKLEGTYGPSSGNTRREIAQTALKYKNALSPMIFTALVEGDVRYGRTRP